MARSDGDGSPSLILLDSGAMLVRPYQGKSPQLGDGVFVADTATIIGDVSIGSDSSVWFGTIVRGDVHYIRIGARSNLQDNCTVHVTNDRYPVIIEDDVTIGHAVVVHGCVIRKGALIGIGSRILDGVEIGEGAIVGAGAVIPEGTKVPARSIVLGVPAKVRGEVSPEQAERARLNSIAYVDLKNRYLAEGTGRKP